MGKLHYVNRKIEGLKLGQVVVKDLLKRIPPGTSHKAALRDLSIDFDVSGKGLTDETFKEIIEALVRVITYQDHNGRVAKLEEISLKGNQLTVRSLRLLAQVIEQSALDIRDLDISNNNIVVNTSQDVKDWEVFLEAFRKCCVLRRVDLSSNALGSKAFEILSRLYAKKASQDGHKPNSSDAPPTIPRSYAPPTIDPSGGMNTTNDVVQTALLSGDISSSPLDYQPGSDISENSERSTQQDSSSSLEKSSPKTSSGHNSVYSTETGLCSIPYLVLSDTGLDDTSAMYLSFVIEKHGLLEHLLPLVPSAKAGPPTQQLEAYDRMPFCRGIIHYPNRNIGSAGARVIELAERTRGGSYVVPGDDDTEGLPVPGSPPGNPIPRRKSVGPVNKARAQITETTSKPFQLTSLPKAGDLDRARSRIQTDTLRDRGTQCNDLWFASLKMLGYARVLLLQQTSSNPTSSIKAKVHSTRRRSKGIREHLSCEEFPRLPNSTYASKTSAVRPSTVRPLALVDPNIPIVLRSPDRSKCSLLGSQLSMTPLSTTVSSTPMEQLASTSPIKTAYRGELLGGLSRELWAEIIARAAETEDLLSKAQKCAVITWGSDRGTLAREMELLGKTEAIQTWKVLDGMNCLAYESD